MRTEQLAEKVIRDIKKMSPKEKKNVREQLDKAFGKAKLHDDDTERNYVLEFMLKNKIELTLENYIDLSYMSTPPDGIEEDGEFLASVPDVILNGPRGYSDAKLCHDSGLCRLLTIEVRKMSKEEKTEFRRGWIRNTPQFFRRGDEVIVRQFNGKVLNGQIIAVLDSVSGRRIKVVSGPLVVTVGEEQVELIQVEEK